MRSKVAEWSELPRGSSARAVARIAAIATGDTVHGGARATVLAERAVSMGLPVGYELSAAVSDVYSRSTGRNSVNYGAWECSECGSIHLGRTAADACCDHSDDDDFGEE